MGKGMVEILSPWICEGEGWSDSSAAITEDFSGLAVPWGSCSCSCSSSSAPSAISPSPSEGPDDGKGGARRGSMVT